MVIRGKESGWMYYFLGKTWLLLAVMLKTQILLLKKGSWQHNHEHYCDFSPSNFKSIKHFSPCVAWSKKRKRQLNDTVYLRWSRYCGLMDQSGAMIGHFSCLLQCDECSKIKYDHKVVAVWKQSGMSLPLSQIRTGNYHLTVEAPLPRCSVNKSRCGTK